MAVATQSHPLTSPWTERSTSPWPCRGTALFLILVSAFLRILYLSSASALDLAPDEAHYWDWARHLDWSYYSKGPLVAWIIHASCWLFGPLSVAVRGDLMLAVRLPAVLFGGLLLAGMYVLTALASRREGLGLAVVALALTMPLLAAGSILMTIDSPFACCWVWALVLGWLALFREQRWAWPVCGLVIGLGILAKYTMVLWVFSLGWFLLFTPDQRRHLRSTGPWVMAGIGALCCLPILIWNWQHDWVTLRHLGGQAGVNQGLHWLGPLNYIGAQFGVLLGFWFVVWVGGMIAHAPWRDASAGNRYLWWLSLPTFLVFLGFSVKNGGGEPNWPITAYISGLVLGAIWLTQQFSAPEAWRRRLWLGFTVTFALLGGGLTLLVHDLALAHPALAAMAGPPTPRHPLPVRRFDPTCRLQGWRTLAKKVDEVHDRLLAQGIEPVLTAGFWNVPGEMGFYCRAHPLVHCVALGLGHRWSQYELWRPNPLLDPEAFKGRTFLYVGEPEPKLLAAFNSVEDPIEVEHRVGEHVLARWKICICHGYRGFPEETWRQNGKW